MTGRRGFCKVIGEVSAIRCASGPGVIRKEVWEDQDGHVARYNLAFVNHFLSEKDHGRVLGYDNGHSYHHRHFMGKMEPFTFEGYTRFL